MGVLNITPDSFSDGGNYFNNVEAAVAHANQMIAAGADIIDIGGESSRPGSDPVSVEEELRRVLPIIEKLTPKIPDTVLISIDTYKPAVARAALTAGAKMLNDITGLTNPEMMSIAKEFNCPVVIMHMQGQPKTMQVNPEYSDVVNEIKNFFIDRVAATLTAGVTNIILDPGLGFGKTLEHNLAIIKRLKEFTTLTFPIMVGPSRKAFIGTITGQKNASERLYGTLGAVVAAVMHGARFVRVHDVAECRQALQVVDAIKNA